MAILREFFTVKKCVFRICYILTAEPIYRILLLYQVTSRDVQKEIVSAEFYLFIYLRYFQVLRKHNNEEQYKQRQYNEYIERRQGI